MRDIVRKREAIPIEELNRVVVPQDDGQAVCTRVVARCVCSKDPVSFVRHGVVKSTDVSS